MVTATLKKMVTVTSLYVFVGNAKKQKQKKLRGQPLLFPSKKKTEKVFHYNYDTGDYMIHNKFTFAPGRDLLLQRRDVQINIADVNPVVRDWRIHPHVVRAQQLHRIIRHEVSVMSQLYSISITQLFDSFCIYLVF